MNTGWPFSHELGRTWSDHTIRQMRPISQLSLTKMNSKGESTLSCSICAHIGPHSLGIRNILKPI